MLRCKGVMVDAPVFAGASRQAGCSSAEEHRPLQQFVPGVQAQHRPAGPAREAQTPAQEVQEDRHC